MNIFPKHNKAKKSFFERFANAATTFTGSSYAFITAVFIVLLWAVSGPFFDYSETWQLVINTGTTIVTFLMVFLIQKTQNKDSKAIQLKLNELIAAQEGSSNRMVDIEDLTEEELDHLHKFYAHLAQVAKKERDITCSHSIDAKEIKSELKTEEKELEAIDKTIKHAKSSARGQKSNRSGNVKKSI